MDLDLNQPEWTLHLTWIFTAYLQVSNLERSLSFYQDGLGMMVEWNDNELAILRNMGDATTHTLVLRQVGMRPRHALEEPGVTRIAWQVTDSADLDRAEERLAGQGVHYQRFHEADADRIVMHDPDGLSVILFQAAEPSLTGRPPASLYWYH